MNNSNVLNAINNEIAPSYAEIEQIKAVINACSIAPSEELFILATKIYVLGKMNGSKNA